MDIRIILYMQVIVGAVVFKMIEQRYSSFNARKNYIIFICTILGLESCLRHLGIGPDTYAYYLWFEDIKKEDWSTIFEGFANTYIYGTDRDPGFPLLVKFIQFFTSNFWLFLTIIAIPYFIALGIFIYRNTLHVSDAVFAFVLYIALFQIIALSGIRQQITTAISLFALTYIQKKDLKKFLPLVLLGSTIHTSLIVIIPFYFLTYLTSNNVKYIYFLALVTLPLVFTNARKIISSMANFLTNEYYTMYYQTKGGGALTYLVLIIAISIVGFISLNKTINQSNKICFIAIALMTFFAPLIIINGALIRLTQYFSLYIMIFIPLIFNVHFQTKYRYLIYSLLIISLVFLSLRNSFQYNFFWQDVQIPREYLRLIH